LMTLLPWKQPPTVGRVCPVARRLLLRTRCRPSQKVAAQRKEAKPLSSCTHMLTVSLSHCLTLSLSHCLTVSLSHCLTVSLSHCLTVSLSHCLTVSLSHCLTLSLSHCLTVSLSHCLTLSLSLSHCLTLSLSHSLPVSLSHCPSPGASLNPLRPSHCVPTNSPATAKLQVACSLRQGVTAQKLNSERTPPRRARSNSQTYYENSKYIFFL
jgi:hypothetical protein